MHSVAVIGMGRFGAAMARELARLGVEVLAIDDNEESVERVRGEVSSCRVLDARDPKDLAAAGVGEVDLAVVAIGESFEASQECVLALKKVGVGRILARAQSHDRIRILEKIGAHRVVSPEVESAKRVAQALAHPLLEDSVDIGEGVTLATLDIPEDLQTHTLEEIGRGGRLQGLMVLRVVFPGEEGERRVVSPARADTVLPEGGRMTVMGKPEDLRRFASRE